MKENLVNTVKVVFRIIVLDVHCIIQVRELVPSWPSCYVYTLNIMAPIFYVYTLNIIFIDYGFTNPFPPHTDVLRLYSQQHLKIF